MGTILKTILILLVSLKKLIGTLIRPILVLLVLYIVVNMAIAGPGLLTAIQRSKQKRTMADMRTIGKALDSYREEYGRYPIQATEAEWAPDIVPASYYPEPFQGFWGREVRWGSKDGWGNEYRYVSVDGTSYTVVSYGKDKSSGGSSWDEDIILSGERYTILVDDWSVHNPLEG